MSLSEPPLENAALEVSTIVQAIGKKARIASRAMAKASTEQKNLALVLMAQMLIEQKEHLQHVNAEDVERARRAGQDHAFIDRLMLTDQVIDSMAKGLQQIVSLKDPIGQVTSPIHRPTGIEVSQMRVPLGVVGIIYESRPNVTIDAAALCIKSGNATILRGGSEAIASNTALAQIIQQSLDKAGLPKDGVQVIQTTDRAAVGAMITMTDSIDVIVPRGGKSLIARLIEDCRVPMIKHLDGICHTYVDAEADITKSITVCDNAKTQRYSPCNAMETLLVNGKIAAEVESLDEAIEHINTFGSHHTDAIMTENIEHATRFLREVDSASVLLNASTRFADGFEYGLGAEIGISNDKLHARGPVGLEGLTSLKYIVKGDGSIRT